MFILRTRSYRSIALIVISAVMLLWTFLGFSKFHSSLDNIFLGKKDRNFDF